VSPSGRRVSRCLSFARRPPVALAWLCLLLPSVQAPARPAAARRSVYPPRSARSPLIAAPPTSHATSLAHPHPGSALPSPCTSLLYLDHLITIRRQRRAVVSGKRSHNLTSYPSSLSAAIFLRLVVYFWCRYHFCIALLMFNRYFSFAAPDL
jgi:hypothetical protein